MHYNSFQLLVVVVLPYITHKIIVIIATYVEIFLYYTRHLLLQILHYIKIAYKIGP